MALSASTVIVPGRGTVLFAPPNTAALNIKSVDINEPSSFTGWDIYHTSKENMVSLSKDGGEATTLDSWEQTGLEEFRSPTNVTISINKLQMEQSIFELTFGAAPNSFDAATNRYIVKELGTTAKAVTIIMVGSDNRRGGWYFPHVKLGLGDMAELDAEQFVEINLSGTVLKGASGEWFAPYQVVAFEEAL